jgi:Flp pilus assembly protein TadG
MSARIPSLRLLSRLPARLRDQRGQAVVEFAIVLPILMLLVLGIIFFGRYENDSSQATSLAELGARDAAIDYGIPYSVNGSTAGTYSTLANFIQGQATGELTGTSDVSKVGVTIECYTSGAPAACPTVLSASNPSSVSVCVQSTVQFPFLGHGSTLMEKATMRIEQPQSAATVATGGGDGLNGSTTQSSTSPAGPSSC